MKDKVALQANVNHNLLTVRNFIINIKLLCSGTFERKSFYLTFLQFCSDRDKQLPEVELIQGRYKIRHPENMEFRRTQSVYKVGYLFVC